MNNRAEADWEKIQAEYKTMLDKADGDESKVDEFKCLKHALGERRGHTRGVGRKVKNISCYHTPGASTST